MTKKNIKNEGSNGLEVNELSESQKAIIDKADAKAHADAMVAITEAQAAEDNAKLNAAIKEQDDNADLNNFKLTRNMKATQTQPRGNPIRNEHGCKPTAFVDSFNGTIKNGEFLRIGYIYEGAIVLNIQLWFKGKNKPAFIVGNMSDYSLYMDCLDGKNKASLQEDGNFDAVGYTIPISDKDIIVRFGSDFSGIVKTIITVSM